ncbi:MULTISPECIES: hypothetical protein [Campylobacter]|uniref:hypothetical protein n=1 Tax=Campylobacter TaxID=194 RepID=UPI0023F43768|nr:MULTISPECIES: hypothetical protein [Campylobacter]MCI6641141.1 hypothetical protein [Campylobacter sp.]MDD7421902.1 hypothetical protein [Campylobacter hominis]MDY3117457.1 hypothetical protein [Campylobacter hominis]
MNEKEILDSFETKTDRAISQGLKSTIKMITFIVFTILLGIYFGNVIFGNRSFEVLQDLKKEKLFLYKDVERLKSENAALQKEFLEKKSLDPELNE